MDADPQGDLTTSLGWTDQDSLPVTLSTQMERAIRDEPIDLQEGILHHEKGVDLIPANIELSGMEMTLVNAMSREFTMKSYLGGLKKGYDYILIDCMPSLGMLTINALAAADSVIVPVQAHYLRWSSFFVTLTRKSFDKIMPAFSFQMVSYIHWMNAGGYDYSRHIHNPWLHDLVLHLMKNDVC